MSEKKARNTLPYVVVVKDYDGRELRREFVDETDALEFRLLITRRVQRFAAGLELIPERVTFREWTNGWREQRRKHRPLATTAGEESKLDRVWLPLLGDLALCDITTTLIASELKKLLDAGLSNATYNRHRALLLKVFNDALRSHPPLVHTNPIAPIKALPEPWKHRDYHALPDELAMERYCNAAWQFGLAWGLIVTILVWSGIRISEALALTWDDVRGDEIRVNKLRCPKTRSVHKRTKGQRAGGCYYALLLPPVRKALEKVRKARGTVKGTDLLTGAPMTYWRAHRLHRYTRFRAGGLKKFTIHRLRHSYGRLLKQNGFTLDDIRDVMGHESVQMTDRYSRTGISHVVRKARAKKLGEKRCARLRTKNAPSARRLPKARRRNLLLSRNGPVGRTRKVRR